MTNGGEVGTRYKIGGRVAAFTGWAAAASCVCSVAMGDMVVMVVVVVVVCERPECDSLL